MSGHVGKVEICSSCTLPVHVEVCNQPIDREYSETTWCASGVQLVRISQWVDGAQTITWQDLLGGVVAAPAAATYGACPIPPNDFEVIERLVCAAGVTIVRREAFNNGASTGVTWFGLNGAAVAAPATFTEGPCDDQDVDLEVEYVCAAGVTLVRRRIVDGETGALISETFVSSNGAIVAAPAAYTIGQCVASDSEVITDLACAAGVQVLRQQTWTSGVLTATNWFSSNGAAIAAPAVFTWGNCPGGSAAADSEFIPLCDVSTNPPTPYIRRASVDPVTGVATYTNINITTGAAFAPVTPSTCDGYALVSDDACLVTNATGIITQVRVTQLYRYGQIVGVPVIVNLQTNAVTTVAVGQTLANCDALQLDSIPWCRIDTGATLIQKVLHLGNLELWSEWIDAVTLATVAAPPAAQLTQDCDIASDFEVVCANIGGVQVSVEVRRTFRDGVLLSTVYTRLDTNAVIAAPTIVPCSPETGARTVLRCGATSNATTTASVQATRVALENDVIFTKACPTTAALTNNTFAFGVNAAVAVGATGVPANARSVTVYNVTRARITFGISSHGTVQIPPNGTYTFNLPDNVPPFSGTFTIANAAGNAGPNVFGVAPHVIVDWGTRV
jgi:hypothetical protein